MLRRPEGHRSRLLHRAAAITTAWNVLLALVLVSRFRLVEAASSVTAYADAKVKVAERRPSTTEAGEEESGARGRRGPAAATGKDPPTESERYEPMPDDHDLRPLDGLEARAPRLRLFPLVVRGSPRVSP